MSAEVLGTSLTLVHFAGVIIFPSAAVAMAWGLDVRIITEVCVILVVVVAVIDLEDVMPVSYAIDVRAGVVIDVLALTLIDVANRIRVDLLTGVDVSI